MKVWQIGLSVICGILFFVSIMNIFTKGFIQNTTIEVVTPSMFYTGVSVIILSISLLCVVIISCTSRIIKEIKKEGESKCLNK